MNHLTNNLEQHISDQFYREINEYNPITCPLCLESITDEGYKFYSTVLHKIVLGCNDCFENEITNLKTCKMKKQIDEIEINGIKYVPKGAEQTGELKIVVLQRGWIYVGRFERNKNHCKLHESSCIRVWGTTKGLQELVDGPTSSTKLDKCNGVVEFDWLTVVHTISVNEAKWIL